MSENEIQKSSSSSLNRRSVVKGAAWSVPVIAAAVAAPAASASVANASLSWTASSSSLVNIRVLDSATVVTAQLLPTIPTEFTLQNGPGAISGTAVVTIIVNRPNGINLTVGSARGFGVYSYDGVPTPPATRTAVYTSVPLIGNVGFPITTYTATQTFNVASNGALVVPVEFGLAGTNSGLTVQALASFPVTLSVDFGGGNVYSATSTITVPVGAGLL